MSQYTYHLNPNRSTEKIHTYKQSELERMTVFRLQEICRKERLVIPAAQRTTGRADPADYAVSGTERIPPYSGMPVRTGWSGYRTP